MFCGMSIYLGSLGSILGFLCGSVGKESDCSAGDLGLIPGLEDPLEEGMATHETTPVFFAGVQPQLIQGIRRRDGVGEGQETTA